MRSVWALLGLLALTSATDKIGNPWTTHASLKLQQTGSNTVTGDEPDVAGTDTLTNEDLVENRFGATPVNIETLKEFIRHRMVSDSGLLTDLTGRAACIIRLEASTGSQLTTVNLGEYLQTREMPTSASMDEMLDRACIYNSREQAVRKLLSEPVADITKQQLKDELAKLGFIAISGTKAELIDRLGKALVDIKTIKDLTGNDEFDTSQLQEVLSTRGLSSDGSTSMLLDRLAGYLLEVSQTAGISGISEHCDLVLASSVCSEGGGKVVSSSASPRGLVAHFTFDDAHGLDSSGRANHLSFAPMFSSGLNGRGSGAKFDGSTFQSGKSHLVIPHSEHFNSPDFCISWWMYLLADATGQWRTVVHKGNADHERTPTFFLEPQTRGLEFFVSTTATSEPAGERLWSNTFVPLRKWTHVAGCLEGRNMRLYINGILDAENTTIGTPQLNLGPTYIGNDPWRVGGGAGMIMDDLRYFGRALSADEIQAQAHNALGGVEPSFVELGCMGCTVDTCPRSCRRGYHMCTERNLFGGGYLVARSMGWANSETRVWSAEDGAAASDTTQATGLCMCCRDDD